MRRKAAAGAPQGRGGPIKRSASMRSVRKRRAVRAPSRARSPCVAIDSRTPSWVTTLSSRRSTAAAATRMVASASGMAPKLTRSSPSRELLVPLLLPRPLESGPVAIEEVKRGAMLLGRERTTPTRKVRSAASGSSSKPPITARQRDVSRNAASAPSRLEVALRKSSSRP